MINFIKHCNEDTGIVIACTAPSRFWCDDCPDKGDCQAKDNKPKHSQDEEDGNLVLA